MKKGTIPPVKLALGFCSLAFLLMPALANEAIWIEGEDYAASTFAEKSGAGSWYHNTHVMKGLLSPGEPGVSDGDWHSHYTSNNHHDSGIATYGFRIAEGGSYTWWIRLNPFHNNNGGADYSYSIDNGPWQSIDLSYVANRMDLVDPGIDIRFIAWTFGAVVDLARGAHTVKVRISDRDGADREGHGGIDAMAFTDFPWAPTGVVRPDPNPPPPGPGDWFMLMAGPDPHSPESITDMSGLIEKPAGRRGFLQQNGQDFVFEDKPFIMAEWRQKPPNQWKAEIARLFAFYGMGLQGWDASYHFAASRSYMGNGWPGMRSYVTCTPHYIGQFPALAYAIYNNHFDEGDVISARRLSTAEIFAGIDKLDQEYGQVGYDENELTAHGPTPVEALAIGRVTLKVQDGQGPSYLGDLSAYWGQWAQVVRSNTGQLSWHYGSKVVTVHSDKTQGVIGFAAGRTYDLPGVTVRVGPTPFVSLLFTPLDNRPLIESAHILITGMAQDKQHGAVYSDDGTELIETGGPPLFLEPVQATLTFKGAPLTSANVVDVYGVPVAQQVERTGNTFSIDGRYATYYYQVKRVVE